MDENEANVTNEGTKEPVKTEEDNTQIVLQEPGKIKKALKWVLGGLAVIAAGVGGFFLLKGKDNDDEEDSADAEGPKDE